MQFNKNYLMENMTSMEIKQAMERGNRTVVIGVGAIEQHGPALPICVDDVLAVAVSCKVAEGLGDALVAPSIRPGYSPQHTSFPGTVSLSHETLSYILRDYIDSYAAQGFETIVIICTHMGNAATIMLTCQQYRSEKFTVIPICHVDMYGSPDGKKYFGRNEGMHANELETSWILHLNPTLVRIDELQKGEVSNRLPVIDDSIGMHYGVDFVSENGCVGDPTGATAELGKRSIELMCKEICREVRTYQRLIAQYKNRALRHN